MLTLSEISISLRIISKVSLALFRYEVKQTAGLKSISFSNSPDNLASSSPLEVSSTSTHPVNIF